jgi:hypothetical protein
MRLHRCRVARPNQSASIFDNFERQEEHAVQMSWEDAVDEAGKFVGSLHLGRVLDGRTIDLTEATKTLPFEGRFKQMILESARRKLRKRGARDVILPPAN